MSRKMAALLLAVLTAGVTGYAVFAQGPRRPREWDNFQPLKAGKKWQYCTLTEAKLDDKGRVAVFVEGAGLAAICNGGWIEAAEKLGLKMAAEHPRKNEPWSRTTALDQMGEMGWELIDTHRGDLDRFVWVFKREL